MSGSQELDEDLHLVCSQNVISLSLSAKFGSPKSRASLIFFLQRIDLQCSAETEERSEGLIVPYVTSELLFSAPSVINSQDAKNLQYLGLSRVPYHKMPLFRFTFPPQLQLSAFPNPPKHSFFVPLSHLLYSLSLCELIQFYAISVVFSKGKTYLFNLLYFNHKPPHKTIERTKDRKNMKVLGKFTK